MLALAANTSFGGLPVLMSLLAQATTACRTCSTCAPSGPSTATGSSRWRSPRLLLVAVGGETNALIPLFTIGVFVGFTISQVGLVRHWRAQRPPRWRLRAALNGAGAAMTAVAVVVFLGHQVPRGRLGRGASRSRC